ASAIWHRRAATIRVVGILRAMGSESSPQRGGRNGGGASARVVFAGAAVLSLALAAALVVLLASGRASTAAGSSFAGAEMPRWVPAPAFKLRDQDGALVDSRELRGELALVTFVYSS